jgi:hypothetical protein
MPSRINTTGSFNILHNNGQNKGRMEEAPENGKESPHSARANGMNK